MKIENDELDCAFIREECKRMRNLTAIPKMAFRKEEIVKMKAENVDNIVDFCVERIKKEGCEVELRNYETTDGRMKYELYVKLPEV